MNVKPSRAEAVTYDDTRSLHEKVLRRRDLGRVRLEVDEHGNIYVDEAENGRLNGLLRNEHEEVQIRVGGELDAPDPAPRKP